MIYIKIMEGDTVVTAEAHEEPVYVFRQKNGMVVRCTQFNAQGILSLDGTSIYQLTNKDSIGIDNCYMASVISMMEYNSISDEFMVGDVEDITPDIPENTTEAKILTRAELTAKVIALEEELTAAKILLGVE